jgi:hypothetical protein
MSAFERPVESWKAFPKPCAWGRFVAVSTLLSWTWLSKSPIHWLAGPTRDSLWKAEIKHKPDSVDFQKAGAVYHMLSQCMNSVTYLWPTLLAWEVARPSATQDPASTPTIPGPRMFQFHDERYKTLLQNTHHQRCRMQWWTSNEGSSPPLWSSFYLFPSPVTIFPGANLLASGSAAWFRSNSLS